MFKSASLKSKRWKHGIRSIYENVNIRASADRGGITYNFYDNENRSYKEEIWVSAVIFYAMLGEGLCYFDMKLHLPLMRPASLRRL